MSRFTDKVAIITGSSFGIGRETAVLLAREGARVTISGRNAERLEETRQQILKAGVSNDNVNVVVGDVTSENVQDELISSTLNKFGRINILINNAGAAIADAHGATGINQELLTYQKTFDLNVKTVISLTQKARPHLAATQGDIVNISSIAAGPQAYYANTYYSMSKAALDQLTRNTAIGLIPEGIRVNAVSPGVVSTGFKTAQGIEQERSDDFYQNIGTNRDYIPIGFTGQPVHIANAIAFLADRNASHYIVGHSIIADGGSTLVVGLTTSLHIAPTKK